MKSFGKSGREPVYALACELTGCANAANIKLAMLLKLLFVQMIAKRKKNECVHSSQV